MRLRDSWEEKKGKVKEWFSNPSSIKNPTRVFEVVVYSFLLILGGFTLGSILFSGSLVTEAEKTPAITEKTVAVAEDEHPKLDKQELNSHKEAVQGLYPTFSSIQPADDMDYRTAVFVKSDTVRQIVLRDKNIQHKLYCYEVEKNSPDDTYHFTRSYMRDDRTYPMDAPKDTAARATHRRMGLCSR